MLDSIETKKIEIIQWLTLLEGNSIVDRILDIKHEDTESKFNLESKEEEISINIGIQEANQNLLNPNSEARKIYEKWLWGFMD